jgi:hypothetical protein
MNEVINSPRIGAADRGEYREAAGAIALFLTRFRKVQTRHGANRSPNP